MKKPKQTKSKKAGSSRKAPKTPTPPKTLRTKERDPRLPAAGTTLTRTYKGRELKVAVLENGFRFEGAEYRSLSALAAKITGYGAVNGVQWFGLATRIVVTPKTDAAKETPGAPVKTRAPKRVAKVRWAGRDPQSAVARETVPEAAPAATEAGA